MVAVMCEVMGICCVEGDHVTGYETSGVSLPVILISTIASRGLPGENILGSQAHLRTFPPATSAEALAKAGHPRRM